MSSHAEQEEESQEEVQAIPGQNWREILLHLYEDEIVVDAHEREGDIPQNADVVEETGLSAAQVMAELEYLEEEKLVEWTHLNVDDISEEFVVYRLTADGFRIAQERVEAIRVREQTNTQNRLNRQLVYATLILVVTGFIQATASAATIGGSLGGVLLAVFALLLSVLLVSIVVDRWGDKIWSTFQQLRQT
jgi:hypothetical protein